MFRTLQNFLAKIFCRKVCGYRSPVFWEVVSYRFEADWFLLVGAKTEDKL